MCPANKGHDHSDGSVLSSFFKNKYRCLIRSVRVNSSKKLVTFLYLKLWSCNLCLCILPWLILNDIILQYHACKLACSWAHWYHYRGWLALIGYPISILEPVPHPQSLSNDQPKLDVPPQPLEFSKDMSYEQLAVWLTNNPLFVGADYQQDISKLRGIIINVYSYCNTDYCDSTL